MENRYNQTSFSISREKFPCLALCILGFIYLFMLSFFYYRHYEYCQNFKPSLYDNTYIYISEPVSRTCKYKNSTEEKWTKTKCTKEFLEASEYQRCTGDITYKGRVY